MYRVNGNQRCEASCDLIFKAIAQLMREGNSFSSITVSQVSNLSYVSRGTFYRHFDSLIDVIVWKSDRMTAESCIKKLLMKNNRQFVSNYFTYWSREDEFLNNLVKMSRMDIILSSLERAISTYTPILMKGTHINKMQEQYIIRIWSVIIWSILCTWIYRGRQESIEDLTELALHNLPDLHREDFAELFNENIPIQHFELRFVSRSEDKEYYQTMGCTGLSWDDMPCELSDECESCKHYESCNPVPMRYLRQ